MRISDWISDVCSSDLAAAHRSGDQRRRDLADVAAHPLCRRPGTGAREALQPASQARPPARRTGQPGQRRPAQGPMRAHCARPLLPDLFGGRLRARSEEHTSELKSLMRTSYAVFCLKKKKKAYK